MEPIRKCYNNREPERTHFYSSSSSSLSRREAGIAHKRAQAVLDLHIHIHPTLSVDHIMRLFDLLIRPILTFDCKIWGVGNYDVIEKVYLNFVKNLL